MKKNKIVGILVCMLMIVATVLPVVGTTNNETGYTPVNSDDEWTMFLHDPERTGYSTSSAPQQNTTLWEFNADGLSSPVIADNKVYVISDWWLNCLDVETGKVLWSFYDDCLGGFDTPTIYDNKVYVVSTGDYIHCLDADTGKTIWNYYKGYGGRLPPVVVDNKLYASWCRGDGNATLLCLDPNTGSRIWDYDFGYQQLTYPMVAYDRVYIGTEDGYLHCLNATTGKLLWSSFWKSNYLWAPTTFDERLYTSWKTRVFCLNPYNGSELWRVELTKPIASSITFAYGKVYFATMLNGKGIYCLDAYDGTEIWIYNITPTLFGATSPVIADGRVYVSTHGDIYGTIESELLCLNATTGELIWKRMMGMGKGCTAITPAIAYGKLFASSGNQSILYCFADASDPPTDPTIRGKTRGLYGTKYNFIVMSEDPDGDDVRYKVDWGDGKVSDWSAYKQSGTFMTFSHVWDDIGIYTIRVMAEDEYHIQSHWSKHVIEIVDAPLLKIISIRGGLFKVKAVIINSGTKNAEGVSWSIKLNGGLILGTETSGTVDIPMNDEVVITSERIVGFGQTIITVDATIPAGVSDIREQQAFVFLVFINVKLSG